MDGREQNESALMALVTLYLLVLIAGLVTLGRWALGGMVVGQVAAGAAAHAAARASFAPGPAPAEAARALIGRARASVRLMAYNFTDPTIAAALVAAKGRGCDVRVVLDRRAQAEAGSQYAALAGAGIPTVRDGHHPIMHDKVIVVDGRLVAFGSYNYSAQAHRNAENLAVVDDPGLAGAYLGHFDAHYAEGDEP